MSKQTDKQRIIALQRMLMLARNALNEAVFNSTTHHIPDVLDEIERLDVNSKPDLIQYMPGDSLRKTRSRR